MITLFFAVLAGICGIQWLGNNIAAGALVLYMKEKGYVPPTQEETRACIKKVVRKKFPWARKSFK